MFSGFIASHTIILSDVTWQLSFSCQATFWRREKKFESCFIMAFWLLLLSLPSSLSGSHDWLIMSGFIFEIVVQIFHLFLYGHNMWHILLEGKMSRWIFMAQLTPFPRICSACERTDGARRPQCVTVFSLYSSSIFFFHPFYVSSWRRENKSCN